MRKKVASADFEEEKEIRSLNNVFSLLTVGVAEEVHLSMKVAEALDLDFDAIKEEALQEEETGRRSQLEQIVQEQHRKSVQAMWGENDEEDEKRVKAQNIFIGAFKQIVSKVVVLGWPLFRMPSSTMTIQLMNSTFLLASSKPCKDNLEIEFLLGLSLMSGRKFLQACEVFRKLQNNVLNTSRNDIQDCSLNLQKAAQIEMLITECLSNSLKSNLKVNSFKRIVSLAAQNSDFDIQELQIDQNEIPNYSVRDEEIFSRLLQMQPHLIKVLLQMSRIYQPEPVKLAILKSIEYVLGILGCSLDSQILIVLKNVVEDYPQNEMQHKLPNYCGFFSNSNGEHNLKNVEIEDKNQRGSNNFKSLKHLYNQILETFIGVLPSMASSVLHKIFYTIVEQNYLDLEEKQIQADLKIYLLKIIDKIIHICQGDITLNCNFLSSLLETIIPVKKESTQQMSTTASGIFGSEKTINLSQIPTGRQETSQKSKKNETVTLACMNLWNTIKERLLPNQNPKAVKCLLKWTEEQLTALQANKLTLSDSDVFRLSVFLEVTQILACQVEQMTAKNIKREEVHLGFSQDLTDQSNIIDKSLSEQKSLVKNQGKNAQFLEIYSLIKPLVFWYDYSLQKQERLPLFRQIWKILSKLLQSLPSKLIQIDMISLNLKALKRINEFCRESNPSKPMLVFLKQIFKDIQKYNTLEQVQKKSKTKYKQFIQFLDEFYVNFVRCIPHQLNDEIFEVTDILIDLLKHSLTESHIKETVNSLIDKYTMKSKQHQFLQETFIRTIITTATIEEAKFRQARNNIADSPLRQARQRGSDDFDEENVEITQSARRRIRDFASNRSDNQITPKSNIKKKSAFEILCQYIFFDNQTESQNETTKEFEDFQEKLSLFKQVITSLDQSNMAIFQKLLENPKLKNSFLALLSKEKTSHNFFELFDVFSKYFMDFCAPKHVYQKEISLEQTGPQPAPADLGNQHTSSQGTTQPIQRNTSRSSFTSNNLTPATNLQFQVRNLQYSVDEQAAPLQLPPLAPEAPLSVSLEVEVLDRERLTLIQIACKALKLHLPASAPSAFQQLHLLGLAESLFGSLLTVPSPLSLRLRRSSPQVRTNEIPQLDSMLICADALPGSSQLSASSQQSGNNHLEETECTDPRYLHARLDFGIKIWPYLEQAVLGSPWSSLKATAFSVLGFILRVDLSQYKPAYANRLKTPLLNLLPTLLKSPEAETKAGALNLIGSFCGLSQEFSCQLPIEQFILQLRQNAGYITIAVWQLVFDLQNDWDVMIREAAGVLVQMCAPEKQVAHFREIQRETYVLKLSGVVFELNREWEQESDGSDLESQSKSQEENYEIDNSLLSENYFYTQNYSEVQIRELLSLFRNEYKPQKALWAEKDESFDLGVMSPEHTNCEMLQEFSKSKIGDLLEDRMVGKLGEKIEDKTKGSQNQETEYLIFERHFEVDEEGGNKNNQDEISPEDLGIIDLDNEQDDFQEPDDDNVPVLKNTYSKRNRPNNSKSVAVGSKTQESMKVKDSKEEQYEKQETVKKVEKKVQEKSQEKPIKPQSAKQSNRAQITIDLCDNSQQTPSFGAKQSQHDEESQKDNNEAINNEVTLKQQITQKAVLKKKNLEEEQRKLIEEEQKELEQEDFEEFKEESDDLEDEITQKIEEKPQELKKMNKSFDQTSSGQLSRLQKFNQVAKKHIGRLNKGVIDKGCASPHRTDLSSKSFQHLPVNMKSKPHPSSFCATMPRPSPAPPSSFPLSPTGSLSQKQFWTGPMAKAKPQKSLAQRPSAKALQKEPKAKPKPTRERTSMQTLTSPLRQHVTEPSLRSKLEAKGNKKELKKTERQDRKSIENKSAFLRRQQEASQKAKQVYVSRTKSQSQFIVEEDGIGQEHKAQWAKQEEDSEAVVVPQRNLRTEESHS